MDLEHERRLAAFQVERPMMIIALERTSGEVIYFPTAEAPDTEAGKKRYRSYVQEHLRCVVPSCPSKLTAVFRTTGVSHFRHLEPVEHDPESLLHHMGKRVIAHWAASRAGWTAQVERASPDGTCRPDVTLTAPGGELAIAEVQYSRLAPEKFEERNNRHLANAFSGRVWLLGNLKRYYSPRKDGRLRVRGLGRQVLDSGAVLLWLDPEKREVVTAYDIGDRYGPSHPAGEYAEACEITSLDECEPDPVHGVLTPQLKAILQADVRRAAVQARRLAQIEAARRTDAEREAAARAELARRQEEWERSADRKWILHQHSDRLPDVITTASRQDQALADKLEVLPVRWKARVYRRIAASPRQMDWTSICRILTELRRGVRMKGPDWRPLSRFVEELAARGLIAYDSRIPTLAGPAGMTLVRAPAEPRLRRIEPHEPQRAVRHPIVIQTVTAPMPVPSPPPPPPPTEADFRAAASRARSQAPEQRKGFVERLRSWWRR
ncbi:competence protein CoiA family protein [Myceligenerans halotolerans]